MNVKAGQSSLDAKAFSVYMGQLEMNEKGNEDGVREEKGLHISLTTTTERNKRAKKNSAESRRGSERDVWKLDCA
ncbi:hypothetical protein ACTXT7_014447 [Hymenolepis weldensis]